MYHIWLFMNLKFSTEVKCILIEFKVKLIQEILRGNLNDFFYKRSA